MVVRRRHWPDRSWPEPFNADNQYSLASPYQQGNCRDRPHIGVVNELLEFTPWALLITETGPPDGSPERGPDALASPFGSFELLQYPVVRREPCCRECRRQHGHGRKVTARSLPPLWSRLPRADGRHADAGCPSGWACGGHPAPKESSIVADGYVMGYATSNVVDTETNDYVVALGAVSSLILLDGSDHIRYTDGASKWSTLAAKSAML